MFTARGLAGEDQVPYDMLWIHAAELRYCHWSGQVVFPAHPDPHGCILERPMSGATPADWRRLMLWIPALATAKSCPAELKHDEEVGSTGYKEGYVGSFTT